MLDRVARLEPDFIAFKVRSRRCFLGNPRELWADKIDFTLNFGFACIDSHFNFKLGRQKEYYLRDMNGKITLLVAYRHLLTDYRLKLLILLKLRLKALI